MQTYITSYKPFCIYTDNQYPNVKYHTRNFCPLTYRFTIVESTALWNDLPGDVKSVPYLNKFKHMTLSFYRSRLQSYSLPNKRLITLVGSTNSTSANFQILCILFNSMYFIFNLISFRTLVLAKSSIRSVQFMYSIYPLYSQFIKFWGVNINLVCVLFQPPVVTIKLIVGNKCNKFKNT